MTDRIEAGESASSFGSRAAISRRRLLADAGLAAAGVSALALAGCAAPAPEAEPEKLPFSTKTVEAPAGRFRGRIEGSLAVFQGVPFMKNPYAAERRFLAPQPMDPFEGTLDCFKPGAIPLQPGRDPTGKAMIGGDGPLCLNIWTPASAEPGRKLPVMVWVPGGGSIRCDQNDPRFDGTAFARDGVILATLAYRVNVDGFMKVEGGDSNLGIRDIIAGLAWVKANIEAFGGDPERIVAFGQSAGGTHLVDVIASPLAKGLLAGAIIQSPSAEAQWKDEGQAQLVAETIAEALGCRPTRDELMKLSPEALSRFGALTASLAKDTAWAQFTEGNTSLFKGWPDGDVMPERPLAAIRSGKLANFPVIAGCTESEWRYYIVPNGSISNLQRADAERLLEGAKLPEGLYGAYAAFCRDKGFGGKPGDVFAQIQSDIIFRMPCERLIESLAAGGARVWAYTFAWKSPVKGKSGEAIGAAHTTDVPFVFETFSAPRALASNGPDAPRSLAAAMHGSWTAFAKTLKAGWPAFTLAKREAMRFDAAPAVVKDPWAFERLAAAKRP